VNPDTAHIDSLSALKIVRLMNAEDARVAQAVENALPEVAQAVEAIAERMRRGGRLIHVGAGTSGRLGVLDAAECPPTFNTPPDLVVGVIAGGRQALWQAVEEVEDRAADGGADLDALDIGEQDAVVGIAASGRTPYVLGAVDRARELGALTIGVLCSRNGALGRVVDIAIALNVGPEVISGSTRLKAGTAQKMVLNMLSTGTMVLLGKTYGNLMVDVRATNSKLRQRAVTIVQHATGLDHETARDLLTAAEGDVKRAIVTGITGVSLAEAAQRLRVSGGVVRPALFDTH